MKKWFSDTTPSAVKVAALGYLADCGVTADLTEIGEELDRGDHQTTSAAIEATLSIKLRDSRERAIVALFDLQPTSINSRLLATLFENATSIDSDTLSQGLGHPSSGVRRMVVKLLRERGSLDIEKAEQLKSDSDAEIRFEALQSLRNKGKQFSDDEARKILVKPKARTHGGIFGGFAVPDTEGESFWKQFLRQRMLVMTIPQLKHAAKDISVMDRTVQFILDERQFSTRGDRLRAAVDDHFKTEFNKLIKKTENLFGKENGNVEKIRGLEEGIVKKFTRDGLDIISRKKDLKDLNRIRNILDSEFVNFSSADIEYLRTTGEWEDIPRIIASLERSDSSRTLLSISDKNNRNYREAVRAIYALWHQRLADLLALPFPSHLLASLIVQSTQNKFRALDDNSMIKLFCSDHDDVRKAAALKSVWALPKGRLTKLLNDYISGDWTHYYNVVHWLDFGISLPKDRSRSAAATVLARQWLT